MSRTLQVYQVLPGSTLFSFWPVTLGQTYSRTIDEQQAKGLVRALLDDLTTKGIKLGKDLSDPEFHYQIKDALLRFPGSPLGSAPYAMIHPLAGSTPRTLLVNDSLKRVQNRLLQYLALNLPHETVYPSTILSCSVKPMRRAVAALPGVVPAETVATWVHLIEDPEVPISDAIDRLCATVAREAGLPATCSCSRERVLSGLVAYCEDKSYYLVYVLAAIFYIYQVSTQEELRTAIRQLGAYTRGSPVYGSASFARVLRILEDGPEKTPFRVVLDRLPP